MADLTQTTLFETMTAPTSNGHCARLGANTEADETVIKWIGSFPADWQVAELSELADFITKGSTPTTYGFDWVDDGVLFLRSECVSKDGFSSSGAARISDEAHQALSRSVVQGGDILMTITGYVGTVCRFPDLGETANINQHIARIRVDSPEADQDFVLYVLSMLAYRQRYERIATGQAYPQISLAQVRSTPIPLPPLPEQRAIARVLGAWDRALADLDALTEAKRQRAKGLAQRLLTGRVRLPGLEDRVPMRPLSEFFRHVSTRNKNRRDLTPLSCSKVHGIVPQSEIFDKRIASENTSSYKVVQRGDLVYDPMLLWDASIGFVDSVDEGVISPAYATFHLNEETADRSFFRHFFDGHYMRHQYKVISQGTNTRRRKAMAKDFLAVEARVPALDEQRQIAAVLDAAEMEVAAIRDQRAALARQKKGLMQRLLTGEVRVTPTQPI